MQWLLDFLQNSGVLDFFLNNLLGMILGGTGVTAILGAILNFVFKRWVTEDAVAKLGQWVYKALEGVGVAVTLGLSRWQYTKKFWNSLIEPVVILVLREVVSKALQGFVAGLQSDVPSMKNQGVYAKKADRQSAFDIIEK